MIRIKNIGSINQVIKGNLLRPGEESSVDFDTALTLYSSPDIEVDWPDEEEAFTPSFFGDKVKGLSVATPLSLFDGYGITGVLTVRELMKRVDIDLYNGGWLLKEDLDKEILSKLNQKKKGWQLGLAKGYPLEMVDKLPTPYVVSQCMWEANKLPEDWLPVLNNIGWVVVPSTEQKSIFKRSGVKTPIQVIADPIDTKFWRKPKYLDLKPKDHFKIISWSRMSSRKMPLEMIQAFRTAFPLKEYPNIRFELKTILGDFGMGKNNIPQFEDPRIKIYNESWTLRQLRAWVARAHLGFFLTRYEGMFNPPMQAMSMSIPCIIADHSGPHDFCNPTYNYPVELDKNTPLVPSPLGIDMMWHNPSFDHTIEQLRSAYNNYTEAIEKGKKAAAMTRDRYNPTRIVNQYMDLFERMI